MGVTCQGCDAPLAPKQRKWCSEQCRRRSYDLVCVSCGGRVHGGDPGKMAHPDAPMCRTCAPSRDTVWTRAAIVVAIQAYADRYGRPPSATEWNPADARQRGRSDLADRFYADDCWPNLWTVQVRFGSWSSAVAAAGFEPMGIGHRYNARKAAAA